MLRNISPSIRKKSDKWHHSLKRLVNPKIKILSLFIQFRLLLMLLMSYFSWPFCTAFWFRGRAETLQTSLKISQFVFQRLTKVLCVWNDTTVSKWWQNFLFCGNFTMNLTNRWFILKFNSVVEFRKQKRDTVPSIFLSNFLKNKHLWSWY